MDRKEFLSNLAKEVLIPIVEIIEKKLDGRYSKAEISKLVSDELHLSEFALIPYTQDFDKNILLNKIKNFEKMKKYGLSNIDIVLILSHFYFLLRKFTWETDIKPTHPENFTIEIFDELIHKVYCKNIHEHTENEFFDLSKTNDELESMHYKDEEKITAKEFMESEPIDKDIVVDIKDLLEDYEDMSYKYSVVSDEFLQTTLGVLQKFITLFMLSGEFKDLGKVTEKLFEKLNNLDLNSLDDNQKQFLKSFLDAFMADLKKWYEEVIIYKSANDIHYLDASLMSSIEQISYFIGGGDKMSLISILKETNGTM